MSQQHGDHRGQVTKAGKAHVHVHVCEICRYDAEAHTHSDNRTYALCAHYGTVSLRSRDRAAVTVAEGPEQGWS